MLQIQTNLYKLIYIFYYPGIEVFNKKINQILFLIDFCIYLFISSNRYINGANEVVIYNFLALITIDTNINQFPLVYHIFYELQQF